MIDAKSFLKHMHILQSFCIAVFLSLFRHNKTPKVFCPTFGVHVKMKGLKIFFNGEEIDVSSDFGVSLMECTKSEKEQSVANLVGIDREKNTYTWLNSLMNTGDVIDMEIAELNRSSVPISVEKFFSEREKSNQEKSDEMWAKDLADYYALEKLLKEEGFL